MKEYGLLEVERKGESKGVKEWIISIFHRVSVCVRKELEWRKANIPLTQIVRARLLRGVHPLRFIVWWLI